MFAVTVLGSRIYRDLKMICLNLKNQIIWSRSKELQIRQMSLLSRYLVRRCFAMHHHINCHQMQRTEKQSLDWYKIFFPRNTQHEVFMAQYFQKRTFTTSPSLSQASTGNINGSGWYESLAVSAPVQLAESTLISLYETSGLPWWANIICATIALRTTVTLPLSIYQMYILAKVENLQPEIEALMKRLRYEVSVYGKEHGWTDKVARFHFRKNMRRIISELYVRDNCHPFKASLLIWIQIPMWIFVSLALRNISLGRTDNSAGEDVQKQLAEGGLLWFPDLTIPDSTWILPVSLGVLNLLIVEIFALRNSELSRFKK
ncbi:hypothetical protein GDO86_000744 [Hymenochirus boettgeri]|uniref:Membrane insertase YidC/Oxa/ALB C-terminal domain-containing protein n=1 Tax=Hymenochirus boettgeri TaxID=247094 RepID=A0A8T2KAQ6_9PIPI|nr:hypothetical protein GDO86_000744 [Hymenochirus boettgeri]